MLESLDNGIGAILGELATQGIANNTLVVYVSDNGAVAPGSNAPLRLGKGNAFDAGSRDAALLTTLPAGTSYTVQASGKNNTTGTVLVEFYLLR